MAVQVLPANQTDPQHGPLQQLGHQLQQVGSNIKDTSSRWVPRNTLHHTARSTSTAAAASARQASCAAELH